MTLDDLCERADELGIRTDMPLVVHEPGEGFYTIEELTITSYGELRLVIQSGPDYEGD
jgi:hypothetical protein